MVRTLLYAVPFLNADVTSVRAGLVDPTAIFSYATEQRLQCTECGRVRYKTDVMDEVSVAVPAVPITSEAGSKEKEKVTYKEVDLLSQCIEGGFLAVEALDYACPQCERSVKALKSVLVFYSKRRTRMLIVHQANKIRELPRSSCRACQEIRGCELGSCETG